MWIELGAFEIVRIQLLDHVGRRGADADVVINHQLGQFLTVNQDDLRVGATLRSGV